MSILLGRDSIVALESSPMLEKLYSAREESPDILHEVAVEAALNTSTRRDLLASTKHLPQACHFCVIDFRHYEIAKNISTALLRKSSEMIDANEDLHKPLTYPPPEILESSTEISEIKSPEHDGVFIESEKSEAVEPLVISKEQIEINDKDDMILEESEAVTLELSKYLEEAAIPRKIAMGEGEEEKEKEKHNLILVENLMALHASILETIKSFSAEQLKHYMEGVFTHQRASKLEPEQREALYKDLKDKLNIFNGALKNDAEDLDFQIEEIMTLKSMLNGISAEVGVIFKEIPARLDECLEDIRYIKNCLKKRDEARYSLLSEGKRCCDAPDELHVHGRLNGIPITLKLLTGESYKKLEKLIVENKKLDLEIRPACGLEEKYKEAKIQEEYKEAEIKEPSKEMIDQIEKLEEETEIQEVKQMKEVEIQYKLSQEQIYPETAEAIFVKESMKEIKVGHLPKNYLAEERTLSPTLYVLHDDKCSEPTETVSEVKELSKDMLTSEEDKEKLSKEKTEDMLIKREETPDAEELYKLYVEELKDLRSGECEKDLHTLEIKENDILKTQEPEITVGENSEIQTEMSEVKTIGEVKDHIEEKYVGETNAIEPLGARECEVEYTERKISIEEDADDKVANREEMDVGMMISGVSSIGIPYYPSESSLPPAIMELIQDSFIARKSIDEIEKKLSDELELLIKSSPPAPCARASVINEVQDPALPYSPSLQSLPIRPGDIDEIKQRAERYRNLVSDSINQQQTLPSADVDVDETTKSTDMPWIVSDNIVGYVSTVRYNKSWKFSQTDLPQIRNDSVNIHRQDLNERNISVTTKINKEDILEKYYDCQSCNVSDTNSVLFILLPKDNGLLNLDQHVNTLNSLFTTLEALQFSDCRNCTHSDDSCCPTNTASTVKIAFSQNNKDFPYCYGRILQATPAGLVNITRDDAETTLSRKNREEKREEIIRKNILKNTDMQKNLERPFLVKDCNVKEVPKSEMYKSNFPDTVGEFCTRSCQCVNAQSENVSLQKTKISCETEHMASSASQEGKTSLPSWALIKLSILSDGTKTIEVFDTSDNPPREFVFMKNEF